MSKIDRDNTFLMRFLQVVFVIVVIALMSVIMSCSPQQRLNRLVKNHPELVVTDTIRIDTTIIEHDTIIVDSSRVDTVIQINDFIESLGDTIVIENEKVRVEILRVRDSVFIRGERLIDTIIVSDTVRVRLAVPCKNIVVKPDEGGWLSRNKWDILGILAICLVITIIIKKLFNG